MRVRVTYDPVVDDTEWYEMPAGSAPVHFHDGEWCAVCVEHGRVEERERLAVEVGRRLGHDLRELATDAEGALHCAWPMMFLRVLDIIGYEDRLADDDAPTAAQHSTTERGIEHE